jgi:hypothetical protein
MRRILLSLRAARLTPTDWDEVRLALAVSPVDELVLSRLTFAAKVRRARPVSAPVLGGKGSPTALVCCALVSTALLGATALALGGGLIFVPAAIPVVTVAAVLGARWWSSRQDHRAAQARTLAADDGRLSIPTDVRDRLDAVLWPTSEP